MTVDSRSDRGSESGRMARALPWAAVLLIVGAWGWLPGGTPHRRGHAAPLTPPAQANPDPISGLFDRRLDVLRKAAVSWELRQGPRRKVVDQVCLVPDVATFLEAISTWDSETFYPILIDDVETTVKFLRAFKPARIIRYPRAASPIPADRVWDLAVFSVGASWTHDGAGLADALPGDRPPKRLGATPPGVVVSSPESPMLAGAVALAAGRFQPLVRFESKKGFDDVLQGADLIAYLDGLDRTIAGATPDYQELGDSCDFVTLAFDAPYAYEDGDGRNALDDKIGRIRDIGNARWAYTGRLMGDAPLSVYRAMCSLFLRPDSAAFFDTYDPKGEIFSAYSALPATVKLNGKIPVTQVGVNPRADLANWHATFDPINRFGLVLINSTGSPTQFTLPQGTGYFVDVPPSVPAAVHMIQSFSAADPRNPNTIAGRWLANGAFLYYGSMNEPFLQAFRPPTLITGLIAEKLPLSAVFRCVPAEFFGKPWRLVYLGDPLYTVDLSPEPPARIKNYPPTDDWSDYKEFKRPEAGSTADMQFAWALKTAIFRLQRGKAVRQSDELARLLLSLPRSQITKEYRPLFDALTIDQAYLAGLYGELRAWIGQIPGAERLPMATRYLETCLLSELNGALGMGDARKAREVWTALVRATLPREVKEIATTRVAAVATSPARRADWRNWLRASLRPDEPPDSAEIINNEIKRLDQLTKDERKNR